MFVLHRPSNNIIDEREAKKRGPWGGIYVGPASEMVKDEGGPIPERVPSQKRKGGKDDDSKGVIIFKDVFLSMLKSLFHQNCKIHT